MGNSTVIIIIYVYECAWLLFLLYKYLFHYCMILLCVLIKCLTLWCFESYVFREWKYKTTLCWIFVFYSYLSYSITLSTILFKSWLCNAPLYDCCTWKANSPKRVILKQTRQSKLCHVIGCFGKGFIFIFFFVYSGIIKKKNWVCVMLL